MGDDVEGVRERIRAAAARSSARRVAKAVGINHQTLTLFAAGTIHQPAGQNWERLVAYAEGQTVTQSDTGSPDTRQIALDALALSGRLNTFAQALLAAGGQPERAEPTPPTLQRAPVAPVDRHHPARKPDEVAATAADAGRGPGRRRRGA